MRCYSCTTGPCSFAASTSAPANLATAATPDLTAPSVHFHRLSGMMENERSPPEMLAELRLLGQSMGISPKKSEFLIRCSLMIGPRVEVPATSSSRSPSLPPTPTPAPHSRTPRPRTKSTAPPPPAPTPKRRGRSSARKSIAQEEDDDDSDREPSSPLVSYYDQWLTEAQRADVVESSVQEEEESNDGESDWS